MGVGFTTVSQSHKLRCRIAISVAQGSSLARPVHFPAVFLVSEAQGGKVRNPKKLHSIKQMLNVYMEDEDVVPNSDDTDDSHRVETTIFEIAGTDRPGLLSDVMRLFSHNGCDVRSAAVWTYQGRVAFVFSVTEKGKPLVDEVKLQRLHQLATEVVRGTNGGNSTCTVRTIKVRGEVHHDRRLHQLMLKEERDEWERANGSPTAVDAVANGDSSPLKSSFTGSSSPTDSAMSVHAADEGRSGDGKHTGSTPPHLRSPKYDTPIIDIGHCSHPEYWTVTIRCRDRTKLLFDTVCTLADLDFDIYHGTIDSDADGNAYQEYFCRPRSGDGDFNERQATLLKSMLESSIQRRFPKGMKVHVRSLDRFGCLTALASQLHQAGLSVTRAKVRTFATSNSCGHTLYVMDAHGGPPDRARVQQALMQCGGKLVESTELADGKSLLRDGHRFSFTFLQRQWSTTWAGGGSPTDSCYGSL